MAARLLLVAVVAACVCNAHAANDTQGTCGWRVGTGCKNVFTWLPTGATAGPAADRTPTAAPAFFYRLLTHTHPHTPHTHIHTATNLLGSIKQLTFVRHGEHHPDVNGTASMCLSERGVSRGLMLARYFDRKVAPKGVLQPTMVLAMNGTTEKADPPSVRPINTAVPYVVTHGIPLSRYIRDFTQTEANRVADYVLANGTGQVVLFVWQHWDGACVRCVCLGERERPAKSHSHTQTRHPFSFNSSRHHQRAGRPISRLEQLQPVRPH